MSAAPVLSVVTPVYNEQEIVPELVGRIVASCRPLGLAFEVVVVNDGSRDATLERLIGMSASVPELRVIDLMRNFGHMPAFSAGVAEARGAAVIVMDGDLQDPPELIPRFLEEWRGGADVVYGLRTARREPLVKRTLIGLFYGLLDRITGTKIPKQVGTFGLIPKALYPLNASLFSVGIIINPLLMIVMATLIIRDGLAARRLAGAAA